MNFCEYLSLVIFGSILSNCVRGVHRSRTGPDQTGWTEDRKLASSWTEDRTDLESVLDRTGPVRTQTGPDRTDSRPVLRQHHNTVSEIWNPETYTCLLKQT